MTRTTCTVPGLWFTVFTATVAAILTASLILAVSVRLYVGYKVDQVREQINNKR